MMNALHGSGSPFGMRTVPRSPSRFISHQGIANWVLGMARHGTGRFTMSCLGFEHM